MKKLLLLLCSAFLPFLLSAQGLSKITPQLRQQMEEMPDADHKIMIVLADQVDSRALLLEFESEHPPLQQRAYETITQLQAKAQATQPDVLQRLSRTDGVQNEWTRNVWIINAIFTIADSKAIEEMANWNEILEISENGSVEVEQPVYTEPALTVPNGTEPGLRAIEAPYVWEQGYTGYGRKVLIIDTGEDFDHPALFDGWWWHQAPRDEAWNGSAFPEDCDQDGGHGSHVTGTACGLDRITNDTIGVAINAHWLGAPLPNADGCSPYNQTVYNVIQSMQWAMDPDDNAQTNSDMPDAINCSFNSGQFSCSTTSTINLMNAVEAAGIAIVWSQGNNGPGSGTVISGASVNTDLVNTFAVGAVNGANPNLPIASFSSRGPTPCGGTGSLQIKPEVSAPGVNVRSCQKGGAYMSIQGTSMAAPHVAGAIVLLKEAFPDLSGIEIKLALYNSATDKGAAGEDNAYGKGVINLESAYNYLINEGHTPVPPVAADNDAILVRLDVLGLCNGPVVPTVLVENSGTSNFTSLHFVYGVEGGTELTYDWTGVLTPKTILTLELPPVEDVTPGDYTFYARVEDPSGQPDPRDLNNQFKRTFSMTDDEYATAEVSADQSLPVCTNSQVLLQYTTDLESNETPQWFLLENGGIAVGEGSEFITPPLSGNTTYYVSTVANFTVGKEELPNGNNGNSIENGLLFSLEKDIILRSVKVYAPAAGTRLIQLLNNAGDVIGTKFAAIQEGESRVSLNFNIPAGSGYQLRLANGNPLYHTSISPGYPHIINDVINIYSGRTAAGINTIFIYYYFFDWEIDCPLECGRTAITVEVSGSGAPDVVIDGPNVVSLGNGGNAAFADMTSGASSWEWDFGNGQTSTDQNASTIYTETGTYTVVLKVTASNGCVTYGTHEVEVVQTSSAFTPAFDPESVVLFPNPAKEVVNLGFTTDAPADMQIQLVDMLGRQVQTLQIGQQASGAMLPVDVQELPSGVYFLQINSKGTLYWTGKFIKN